MKMINKYINFISFNSYNLIGLSIVRIAIGVVTLLTLLANFQTRFDLWENSLFNTTHLHMNHLALNIFYFVLVVSIIIYILGIESIIFNLYIYVMIYLLYGFNNYILDGGNNILIIVLFYMIFTRNAQYFSLYKGNNSSHFRNSIHNIFLFLILFQVCVLYFFAGFAKARGYMWFSGVAPYYVFQIKTFTMAWTEGLFNFVIDNSFILLIISYTSIFMQMLFPVLIFNKITKIIVVIGSVGFHISIVLFMGLVTFGLIMIALDLLFINDVQYKKIYRKLKERRNMNVKQKGNYI
ncbi:vitamin K-dependent gamma-carboxylase-like protein [Staphylococcus epidermidis]|uniref:HTTM domain-containing protein n=1 Tax=Staphylococcus epidermidis TaxID=1282 RepID=UPI00138AFF89|nr:hypothetical protein [Staphylococcus epidermidis]MCG2103337.1 HTTM domain-containing protein [Staphylococcus epidermidis]